MALRMPVKQSWCAAAGLSLAIAGCTSTSKLQLAKKNPAPAATAVSGSGEFAPDSGAKHPEVVHLAYGQWQEQMGQQAEARESYSKVLAKQPKNVEAILGMARLDQAAGLYADAEERLKKAIKLAPKDPRVLACYGNFYSAQGEWAKAVEMQQAAVKLAPEDQRYQYLLGVALTRSGQLDAAFPYFVRAVGDAQAHYNIGYILHEQGDRAGALQRMEQALALRPDLELAQQMIDRIQGGNQTVLASATDQRLPGAATTPGSNVRSIPLSKQEEMLPLKGNEALLPRGNSRQGFATRQASAAVPAPAQSALPPGLSPAQLEQMQNQQGH